MVDAIQHWHLFEIKWTNTFKAGDVYTVLGIIRAPLVEGINAAT